MRAKESGNAEQLKATAESVALLLAAFHPAFANLPTNGQAGYSAAEITP
jgi:hypothetical protein